VRRINNLDINTLSSEFVEAFESLVDSIVAGKPSKYRGSVAIKYEFQGFPLIRLTVRRAESRVAAHF
jgi:hypothetical protein